MKLPIPQFVRTHKKKSIAGAVVLVLVAWGVYGATRPKQAEVISAVAERGDLTQTVEAVGEVTSERELELRFPTSGVVSNVYVKENQKVAAGQKLAQLRSGSLGASVSAQRAALDSAMADLAALEQGTRPEDIAIAEADLANKRASLDSAKQTLASAEMNLANSQTKLDTLRREADVNLAGEYSNAVGTLLRELSETENALTIVDDMLSRTDVNDAIVKNAPGADADIRNQQRKALQLVASARTKGNSATDYQAAIDALNDGANASRSAVTALDALFSLLGSLKETAYLSAATRESYRSQVATERSSAQTSAESIGSTLSSLRNASATYDTRIAAEEGNVTSYQGTRDKAEADIRTYEASVRSAEAQLDLKRAGARQTDIDAARARVRQQQAQLARTQADYSDTILVAPIAGTVTHVNVRIGESLPAGAAVTLLGDSPYRVEMFVSEIDIPKVAVTQSGSIELDAFRNKPFTLRVGDVDEAATDKDGVPKYRVRLDFVQPSADLKIGMTGDADIITGFKADVVHIPLRAIVENDKGEEIVRILEEDGTWKEVPVTLGMEGSSGDVEVVSGVKEGDTVIVLVKQ
jgi:RND family efflux transporter MFP subunit